MDTGIPVVSTSGGRARARFRLFSIGSGIRAADEITRRTIENELGPFDDDDDDTPRETNNPRRLIGC